MKKIENVVFKVKKDKIICEKHNLICSMVKIFDQYTNRYTVFSDFNTNFINFFESKEISFDEVYITFYKENLSKDVSIYDSTLYFKSKNTKRIDQPFDENTMYINSKYNYIVEFKTNDGLKQILIEDEIKELTDRGEILNKISMIYDKYNLSISLYRDEHLKKFSELLNDKDYNRLINEFTRFDKLKELYGK